MFGRLALGLALSCALATSAMAAGPLEVSTQESPFDLGAAGALAADLATIGVHFGLGAEVTVQPEGPQPLDFWLLANDGSITSLDVGGSSFNTPAQAFSGTGTLLGEVTTASELGSLIHPDQLLFYLSDSDTAQLTGIGPWIGNVDHFYFSAYSDHGDLASLFEVSVASVPEPATWAMLILGLALIGLAARRRREGATVAA